MFVYVALNACGHLALLRSDDLERSRDRVGSAKRSAAATGSHHALPPAAGLLKSS